MEAPQQLERTVQIRASDTSLQVGRIEGILKVQAYIYSLTLMILYGAAAEWALVQQGLLKFDPAILFVLLAIPFLVMALFQQTAVFGKHSYYVFLRSQLPVLVPFSFLVLVSLIAASGPRSYWGQGGKYVFSTTFDMFVFSTGLMLGCVCLAIDEYRSIVTVTLVVLAGSVVLELVVPTLLSPDPVRPGGLAVNPNRTAFMACLLASACIHYDRIKWTDLFILIMTGASILIGMSRAGIIYFGALVTLYIFLILRSRKVKLPVLIGILACLALLALGVLFLADQLVSSGAVLGGEYSNQRSQMFTGDRDFEWIDEDRVSLVYSAVSWFLEAPFLGNGTGFTLNMDLGWHNMYLRMAVDNGILGLGAYIWLTFAALAFFLKCNYKPGYVFMALWCLEGFFNHNLIDNRGALVILGSSLIIAESWRQKRENHGQISTTFRTLSPSDSHTCLKDISCFTKASTAAMFGRHL